VASHGTQHAMVPVSRPVIQASADAVHKIRLVLRFLLSVLDSSAISSQAQQHPHMLDRYLLHLLYEFHQQVTAAYDSYQFNRVCSLITNFVTNDVSALYCHLIKDRLYCDKKDDPSRLACQQVVGHILNTVLLAIGPILPYLAEEVYLYHPHKDGKYGF
jgi:isoleucyl-tRNA synthetase